MDRAWEGGLHWFDTGDAYGGGTSETWIGDWCATRGVRPRMTTKVFHSTTGDPATSGSRPTGSADSSSRAWSGSASTASTSISRTSRIRDVRSPRRWPASRQLRGEGLIGAWGL